MVERKFHAFLFLKYSSTWREEIVGLLKFSNLTPRTTQTGGSPFSTFLLRTSGKGESDSQAGSTSATQAGGSGANGCLFSAGSPILNF